MNSSPSAEENKITALEFCRMVKTGASREDVLQIMRQAGFNKIESIKMLRSLAGLSLAEAKRQVHLSPVWQDRLEADNDFHEQLYKARAEV